MAVLHIWTTEGGETAPSATDIAMFFKDKDEWLTTLDRSWSRIGLGLPLSPDLRRAAEAFYKSCADRLKCVSPLIAAAHASRAMKPAEALKQARLRQLAWVTSRMRPSGTPVEMTTRNNPRMRPPKGTDPSKMKPDLLALPRMKPSCCRSPSQQGPCRAITRSYYTKLVQASPSISRLLHATCWVTYNPLPRSTVAWRGDVGGPTPNRHRSNGRNRV